MNPDVIILRYGELSLKSAYVRKHFEATLLRNIQHAFTTKQVSYKVWTERGRIYLTPTDFSKARNILPQIFGIVSFSPALKTTSLIHDISVTAQQLTKNLLNSQRRFAVRVTRVGTHPYTSQDVAVQIGSDILQSTHAKVDLNTPDLQLFIEIRGKNSFLFTEKIKGTGGLPMGTQGRVLALVSKPSSLLAAWFLMRRGCDCVFVIAQQINENMIHSFLASWYAEAEIFSLDLTNEHYLSQISRLAVEKNCEAVVIDNTFEVPAQTIATITQLKKHIDIPILTPLLQMTREEVEHQCRQRGILP